MPLGTIETARLWLRAPEESDAEIMLRIRSSDFVREFNCMSPVTPERMRELIRREAEKEEALYLVRKADNRLLGGIWLSDDDLRFDVKSLCLSYYLEQSAARQGYMKEALSACITALFRDDPALEVISARVFRGNTASERLLLSLGFTYEGCLRRCVRDDRGLVHDDMQFSLLREEWRPTS